PTEEVQAVVRACRRERIPFVARGAGTGLSGGATPVAGGVVVSLARMNRILEVDLESQRVVVEPGVANLDVTGAVSDAGFFYAPDPSSQQVCTIGGNVAENSGGAHCLKHGFTVHHVTALTLVLPDGEAVELEGVAAQVDEDAVEIKRICRECGSFEIRAATDETSRALLWKGRKSAFAAMGRVATDYYVQDGVVPRTRLPDVLRRIEELSETHGLRVGNVFHAGDGNLHPLVLYDAAQGESERARELAEAILDACLEVGGSLTGEHGVGMDKACSMPRMFAERDLETFVRVRRAFDPDGICNPGKVIPTPRLC